MAYTLKILPKTEGKGRTFVAELLGIWESSVLGDDASSNVRRPLWLCIAASEGEIKPMVANLRLGRKAAIFSGYREELKIEFLKSAGYKVFYQKMEDGIVVATIFHPYLFMRDPGMVDPERVELALLPPTEWVEEQEFDESLVRAHLKRAFVDMSIDEWVARTPVAALFAIHMDRRSHCPLPDDIRFYTQMLVAAVRHGFVSFEEESTYPSNYGRVVIGVGDCGFFCALSCRVSHEVLQNFLAAQVSLYYAMIAEQE